MISMHSSDEERKRQLKTSFPSTCVVGFLTNFQVKLPAQYYPATSVQCTDHSLVQRMSARRVRNVCFTLNNPTLDPQAFLTQCRTGLDVRYVIIGVERAPTTGTRHYQGYLELNKAYTYSRIQTTIGEAHLEARAGTPQQAADYCKEDGDFHEWGEISQQGNRSDISEAVGTLLSYGPRQTAIAHPEQFVRYHRGFQALFQTTLSNAPREAPTVSFLYGPPGCGKTRLAFGDGDGVAKLCLARGWFDGYNGEPSVIFDDLDGAASHLSVSELLNYLDRYPVLVPVKGGHMPLVATRIWVTSNRHWKQWYDWSDRAAQYLALCRRFTDVYCWSRFGRGHGIISREADPAAFRRFCDGPLTTGVSVVDITRNDDPYYTFVEDFVPQPVSEDEEDEVSEEIV